MNSFKMKIVACIFALMFVYGCTAQETEADDGVDVSAKCAAVILASTTTLGVGLASLTPAALCTAGFCATGVTGGNFASWWQSTVPLVVKGDLFAQLQSMAMGGIGVSSTVTASAVGGLIGGKYLRDFCTFVDEIDPHCAVGQFFEASQTVITTTIKTKEKIQSHWQSEAGTATRNKISSMWDSFTTGAYSYAQSAKLKLFIIQYELEIDELIGTFGVNTFDYIRREAEVTWGSEIFEKVHLDDVENKYNDVFEKVCTNEALIVDNESKGSSTRSLEREIRDLKTKFGVHVFDLMRRNNAWNDYELVKKINALELLIQDKRAEIAEL